jgi:hypothetical protein
MAFHLPIYTLGRYRPSSRERGEKKPVGQVLEALGLLHILLPCIVSAMTL